MERFDLEANTANLINEFDKASFNGTLSILEWFYKALNYKSLFEGDFAETIYKRLIERGYTEVLNPVDELNCYKALIQTSNDLNSEKVGYTIISLLLKNINEKTPISPDLAQFVEIYNETFNKEKTHAGMMKNIQDSIGENVVFVIIRDGRIELLTGTLNEVDPYHSVTIDEERYPFIGFNIEINKITNQDGKVLFNNHLASTTDMLDDANVIEKKNLKLFGNNYNKELRKVC